MKAWKTTLHLQHSIGSMSSKPISIKCGIFQGDSLSPLLLCLTLAPLNSLLNESSYWCPHRASLTTCFTWMTLKHSQRMTSSNRCPQCRKDVQWCHENGVWAGQMCQGNVHERRASQHRHVDLEITTTIKELEQEGHTNINGIMKGMVSNTHL